MWFFQKCAIDTCFTYFAQSSSSSLKAASALSHLFSCYFGSHSFTAAINVTLLLSHKFLVRRCPISAIVRVAFYPFINTTSALCGTKQNTNALLINLWQPLVSLMLPDTLTIFALALNLLSFLPQLFVELRFKNRPTRKSTKQNIFAPLGHFLHVLLRCHFIIFLSYSNVVYVICIVLCWYDEWFK